MECCYCQEQLILIRELSAKIHLYKCSKCGRMHLIEPEPEPVPVPEPKKRRKKKRGMRPQGDNQV